MSLRLTIHPDPQGYSLGTYEWVITDSEGGVSSDGGYHSEEHAREAGEKTLAELRNREREAEAP